MGDERGVENITNESIYGRYNEKSQKKDVSVQHFAVLLLRAQGGKVRVHHDLDTSS